MTAPYKRGVAASERQVKSRAELEAEELVLDDRKGPILDKLDDLLDGGELDTASARKVAKIRERIDKAESGARIDELLEQFKRADIRWRVSDDYDYEVVDDDDGGGDTRAALGPGRADVDYGAQLRARRYDLRPHGEGICDIVQPGPAGSQDSCQRAAGPVIPGGKICSHHYNALNWRST